MALDQLSYTKLNNSIHWRETSIAVSVQGHDPLTLSLGKSRGQSRLEGHCLFGWEMKTPSCDHLTYLLTVCNVH